MVCDRSIRLLRLLFVALFGERIAPYEPIYFVVDHGDRVGSARHADRGADRPHLHSRDAQIFTFVGALLITGWVGPYRVA